MRYLTLITILFFVVAAFSQGTRLVILDSLDKKPLEYVSCYVKGSQSVQFTDSIGILCISNAKVDTVYIRKFGYHSRVISSKELVDTIFLAERKNVLPEVHISKSKTKELKFGEFDYKRNHDFKHDISSEFIRRIHISNLGLPYKLKQVMIPMGFHKKYSDSCYCHVHIYRKSIDHDGMEDVLKKPVIISNKTLPRSFYLDIADQEIYLSDSTIYVGLDCTIRMHEYAAEKIREINAKNRWSGRNMHYMPIWFHFTDHQLKNYETEGLTYQRIKNEDFLPKSKRLGWRPVLFNAGIVIQTFE